MRSNSMACPPPSGGGDFGRHMAALDRSAAHRFFPSTRPRLREKPREIERGLHVLAIDIAVEHHPI